MGCWGRYDVREKTDENAVRNLGMPVELAKRYYDEGADEIAFLIITSFREMPLSDQPMLEVTQTNPSDQQQPTAYFAWSFVPTPRGWPLLQP